MGKAADVQVEVGQRAGHSSSNSCSSSSRRGNQHSSKSSANSSQGKQRDARQLSSLQVHSTTPTEGRDQRRQRRVECEEKTVQAAGGGAGAGHRRRKAVGKRLGSQAERGASSSRSRSRSRSRGGSGGSASSSSGMEEGMGGSVLSEPASVVSHHEGHAAEVVVDSPTPAPANAGHGVPAVAVGVPVAVVAEEPGFGGAGAGGGGAATGAGAGAGAGIAAGTPVELVADTGGQYNVGGTYGDDDADSVCSGTTTTSCATHLSVLSAPPVDRFGFIIPDGTEDEEMGATPRRQRPLTVKQHKAAVKLENLRLAKWLHMLEHWSTFALKKPRQLKERIRKGIPNGLRHEVWMRLSGARTLMNANSSTYALLLKETTCSAEAIIQRDLGRTFPYHVMFQDAKGAGQAALFNVLRAYARYDPEVNYCQGMGFIAGGFLMYMPEEEAFWLLASVMNTYRMRGIYAPHMPRFELCCYQLEALLAARMPKLSKHFQATGVSVKMFASQWFITLFAYNFSFDVVVRIWDIFISEGWKIVFRVGLSLLKRASKQLLKLPMEEILPHMRHFTAHPTPDEVIHDALKVRVTTAELEKLEREWREQVAVDMAKAASSPVKMQQYNAHKRSLSGSSGMTHRSLAETGSTALTSPSSSSLIIHFSDRSMPTPPAPALPEDAVTGSVEDA